MVPGVRPPHPELQWEKGPVGLILLGAGPGVLGSAAGAAGAALGWVWRGRAVTRSRHSGTKQLTRSLCKVGGARAFWGGLATPLLLPGLWGGWGQEVWGEFWDEGGSCQPLVHRSSSGLAAQGPHQGLGGTHETRCCRKTPLPSLSPFVWPQALPRDAAKLWAEKQQLQQRASFVKVKPVCASVPASRLACPAALS